MNLSKKSHSFFAVLQTIAISIFATTAAAQLQVFQTSNLSMQIYTMSPTNADASIHNLNVNIATNGVITGNGIRFDLPASSFNANPTNGTAVSINATASRVGLPVVPMTNVSVYYDNSAKRNLTNWAYTTNAPATILLNDGTRFKGTITKTREVYQYWDGSRVATETNNLIYTGVSGIGRTVQGRIGQGSAQK